MAEKIVQTAGRDQLGDFAPEFITIIKKRLTILKYVIEYS